MTLTLLNQQAVPALEVFAGPAPLLKAVISPAIFRLPRG